MNRKKLLLGIIAAALSLVLAIGGTFMILHDDSLPVINTVTIEYGLTANLVETITEGTDAVASGSGYNYAEVEKNGGDIYSKIPTVSTDLYDVPSYVRVKYTFSAIDNTEVTEEGEEDNKLTQNDAVALNSAFRSLAAEFGVGWSFDATEIPDYDEDDGTISGYIYYATTTPPTIVNGGQEIPPVFNYWNIPAGLSDDLESKTVNLTLQAEAEQVKGNAPTGAPALKDYFPDFQPE
ncbi:MAG: hypothetical protein LBU32_01550 [Clostridiales bacterium]|jgi:hypothetical protein|nr:hypothetical protein [Clostridiales bacterium]